MTQTAAVVDSDVDARQLERRNFVEMFRGGICTIEPFFIAMRDILGKNADIAELRSLLALNYETPKFAKNGTIQTAPD